MRAFTVPEFNAPGSITEQPRPEAGAGQILVRVHAAGVNPMDPSSSAAGWRAWSSTARRSCPGSTTQASSRPLARA